MKLYFIPFACSLATRIAINEAELDAEFVQVTPGQPLPDGRDFAAISPMGYVPAMEAGAVTLSEGPAVLTYIADLAAEGVLAPAPYTAERYELTKWLNFISTEIHKGVFAPLMTQASTDGAREWARSLADKSASACCRRISTGGKLPARRFLGRRRLSAVGAQLDRVCGHEPSRVAGAKSVARRDARTPFGRGGDGDRDAAAPGRLTGAIAARGCGS